MLLERDDELQTLRAAINNLGEAVLVRGGPGLGKTVLLHQAEELAKQSGLQVLSARRYGDGSSYAFGAVRQLSEKALADRPGLLEERAIAPGLAAVHTETRGAGPGDFAVLHGLYRLTALLAQSAPLALVVDDLHWVDSESLRFLAYLLPRLRGAPIVGIWSTRPATGSADPGLTQLLEDPPCRVLRPAPLTLPAAGRLLATDLGLHPEAAFVEACHTASEGNPLFVVRTRPCCSSRPRRTHGRQRPPDRRPGCRGGAAPSVPMVRPPHHGGGERRTRHCGTGQRRHTALCRRSRRPEPGFGGRGSRRAEGSRLGCHVLCLFQSRRPTTARIRTSLASRGHLRGHGDSGPDQRAPYGGRTAPGSRRSYRTRRVASDAHSTAAFFPPCVRPEARGR
ncbi:ATP-binding protein [Streptomyces sp. PKU-EA00015]|nr:ATP-binding protein [Streptomyces sp. PKU-EA00015]